jgi:phenylacetate-CoA ligase
MNRWLAENIFWPTTERLCRRNTMHRLRTLKKSSAYTREQIVNLQEKKLRELLQVADVHCPFYHRRFKQAGIDPDNTTLGLNDLSKLPTLHRDEIREHLYEMTWHACPRGGPQPYSTGGSSGKALQFYFDRFRQAADQAARWNARNWWNVRPGDTEILLWGAPVELNAQDRVRQFRDALLNQHMLNAFDMTTATMDEYIDTIRRLQPSCLYGYAGSLALLARHILDKGLSPGDLELKNLKAVFATGEVLLQPDRELIEQAFAAPVAIEYGCRDGGLLAHGCPAGPLHVLSENVIVEILDQDNEPVAPGQVGEVVVTHLHAFAMPLIRYRVGDLARKGQDEICACGRQSPTLTEVQGRTTDQVVCRQGNQLKRMHALSLIYVLRETRGLRNFRITQPNLDELNIDVVTDETFNSESETAIKQQLAQRLHDGVNIHIHHHQHLPPSASGKHACVISHV